MADINVAPKRRTSAWVWFLVAIIVALIVWAIVAGMNTPTQAPVSELNAPVAAPAASVPGAAVA